MAQFKDRSPYNISRLSYFSQTVLLNSYLTLASFMVASFFIFWAKLSTIPRQKTASFFIKLTGSIGFLCRFINLLTLTISRGTIQFATTISSSRVVDLCTVRIAITSIPKLLIHVWRQMAFQSGVVVNALSVIFVFLQWSRVKFLILQLLKEMDDENLTVKTRWRVA